MTTNKQTIQLNWPFSPSKTDLNADTNFLKIIAMLTMVCDHCGKMFFPQYRIMRMIGRIAFPIYAYCIACGCVYTRDILKYFKRIVLLALVSQPIYAIALDHTVPAMFAVSLSETPLSAIMNFYVHSWNHPSILMTLAIGVAAIWSIRERHLTLTAAIALAVWLNRSSIDYGWKGVLLIVLFYLTISKWWISLPILGSFMVWWGLQSGGYKLFDVSFGIQMFMLMSIPFVYIHTKLKPKIPKRLFYMFYPAHLCCIYLLERIL